MSNSPTTTRTSVTQIFTGLCRRDHLRLRPEAEVRVQQVIHSLSERRTEQFGNAREIRTLYERMLEGQAARLGADETADPAEIVEADIP
jgi:AAA lid domain